MTETDRSADALVADARRAVHEALVVLAAPEADRVRALVADLETAVEGRTAIRMSAPAPAPSGGALRDRIASALWAAGGPAAAEEANVDAVLGVLAGTDRTSVLLWAADQIDAETQQLKAHQVLEPDKFRPCRDASEQLRRLAAETQCPGVETTPNRCACGCEGCKHHCGAHDPNGEVDALWDELHRRDSATDQPTAPETPQTETEAPEPAADPQSVSAEFLHRLATVKVVPDDYEATTGHLVTCMAVAGGAADPDCGCAVEAHPPTITWKIETPLRGEWRHTGATHDDHTWATERYQDAIDTDPAREFRLVRATTAYTVEAAYNPDAPVPVEAAANGEETP